MINLNIIASLARTQQFERLISRLLGNGRCLSPSAGRVMRTPEGVAAAALGLGLQRVCELSYWPHSTGAELADGLIRLQRRDGLFGEARSSDGQPIAGSAAALRGLIEWTAQFDAGDVRAVLAHQAIDRAWQALHDWCMRALTDDSAESDVLAVMLWQLGDCDEAHRRLPVRQLRERVSGAGTGRAADDLSRLALTMAA